MKDVIAMVLAGGKVGGFEVLTENRAKSALPFAGSYRLIDCSLSSLSHSEIERVGLIIQYLPASLIEHVGIGQSWDFHGYGRTLKIMPPFVGLGKIEWFKGTADAIYKNLDFIYEHNPKDVLVLCGDHLYQMDFRPILEFHRKTNAEMTVVGKRGKPEELSNKFGYFNIDENNKITQFIEKPSSPISDLYSVGIYIFKTDVLLKWLAENNSLPENSKTNVLAYDIIQKYILQSKAYSFIVDNYWNYVEDVNVYFLTHLEMLKSNAKLNISSWNILTNLEDRSLGDRTPFYSGDKSQIEHSLISSGCSIKGKVEWSVLSPGVIVEEGAEVRHSIIFHDCVIKKGAKLNRVVSDKDNIFAENCVVGEAADIPEYEIDDMAGTNQLCFRKIPNQKLTIIGKNVKIGSGVKIPNSCVIQPNTDLSNFSGKVFDCGERI